MSEINGVDVNIMGEDFTVSCTNEERPGLINAVNFLDKKMRDYATVEKLLVLSVLLLWPR